MAFATTRARHRFALGARADDHVHILCRLSKTLDVAALIRELKRDSSKWMKDENPRLTAFYWRRVTELSVSPRMSMRYEIHRQPREHHRRETFQVNFAGCARNMVLRLMSDMFGIERPCDAGDA